MKLKIIVAVFTILLGLTASPVLALDTPEMREAYKAFNQGDYPKAISLWESALLSSKVSDRDKGQINLNMGLSYVRLGKPELAERHLEIALQFDPHNPEIFIARGDVYSMQGNVKEAIVQYTNAIALDPDFYGAYLNRAIAYSKAKSLPAALADFDKALALGAPPPQVYNSRGNAYEVMGDLDNAMQQFSRAIELNPAYPSPYFNRSRIYERLGDLDKALEDAKQFARLARQHPWADLRVKQLIQKMEAMPSKSQ